MDITIRIQPESPVPGSDALNKCEKVEATGKPSATDSVSEMNGSEHDALIFLRDSLPLGMDPSSEKVSVASGTGVGRKGRHSSTLDIGPGDTYGTAKKRKKASSMVDLSQPIEPLDSGLNVRSEWQRRVLGGDAKEGGEMDDVRAFRNQVHNVAASQNIDYDEAQLKVFTIWLVDEVGSADSALIVITLKTWFTGRQTTAIVNDLLNVHGASASVRNETNGNTALHQATSNGQTGAMRALLRHEPLLWRTLNGVLCMPLEVALDVGESEAALVLLEAMPKKEVRRLFKTKRSFHSDLVRSTKVKPEVVRSALDCLAEPWPERDGKGYTLHYDLLESDHAGRLPGQSGFQSSRTCFNEILSTPNLYRRYGSHRVVRMLLNSKWSRYGEKMLWLNGVVFLMFIGMLTYALVVGGKQDNPTNYKPLGKNIVRAICEVVVLMYFTFGFIGELQEMYESRYSCTKYWKSQYNLIQLLSCGIIFTMLALRYAEIDTQWTLAAFLYLISALRFIRIISTSRFFGVYMRICVGIVIKVLPRFFMVFGFVLLAFSGSLYVALRAETGMVSETVTVNGTKRTITREESDLDIDRRTGSYEEIIFTGVRILIQGGSDISYYGKDTRFGWLGVTLFLLFILSAILIMRTILIAQMVTVYGSVQRTAILHLEQNRASILPELEASNIWRLLRTAKFCKLPDWRVTCYVETQDITAIDMQELLQEVKVDNFEKLESKLMQQDENMMAMRDHVGGLITQQLLEQEHFNQEVKAMLSAQTETRREQHQEHDSRLNKLEEKACVHGQKLNMILELLLHQLTVSQPESFSLAKGKDLESSAHQSLALLRGKALLLMQTTEQAACGQEEPDSSAYREALPLINQINRALSAEGEEEGLTSLGSGNGKSSKF